MKKMGRKILAVVAAVCMAVGLVTVPPGGAEKVRAEVFGDFAYTVLDDGTVEITEYTGSDNNMAIIPETILGNLVTRIATEAFRDHIELKIVSIPNGIRSIEGGAFWGCESLEVISIPDSVTSIGRKAFFGCKILNDISLPSSITGIEGEEFWGCKSLEAISIPDSVTNIRGYAFYACTGLKEIRIPDSVKSIEVYAFGGCDSLSDVYYSGTEEQWNELRKNIGNENTNLLNATIHYTNVIEDDKDYEYGVLDNGSIEIIKYKGSNSVVNIPEQIDRKSVTSIGEAAFSECTGLTGVSIPDSVTNIGKNAFFRCISLAKIEISDSVTSIGEMAFAGCIGLKKIEIPSGLINIEDRVFTYCIGLTEVIIPNGVVSLGSGVFNACIGLTSISIPTSVTNIGGNAFSECIGLTEINIPNHVDSLGESVFRGCKSLIQINIPNSVDSIGESAFSGCTGLKGINIPSSVTSIGRMTFYECTNLTEISIPDSVTSIGSLGFYHCTSLKDVYYSGTEAQWNELKKSIGTSNTALFNATIHYNAIPTDDTEKDYEYEELTNGTIKITAYKGSDASITIPAQIKGKSVSSIGESAFENCKDITSVTITNGISGIEAGAFAGCSGLKGITLPESVASIGAYAFSDCSSLTKIEIPYRVTAIGNNSFVGCSLLKEIKVDDKNSTYCSENGIVYSKDKKTLVLCTNAKTGTVKIPDGVTQIAREAFCGCSSLTDIIIPESVSSIGDCAFENCKSLAGIVIPDGVTVIEQSTFCECRNLASISIPDSVTSIDVMAFSGCERLTSIVIPKKVTRIGHTAFQSCENLESITIPVSMEEIEEDAFVGCDQLMDVYYSGTKEQWDKINISIIGNDNLLNATKHYTKEDTPSPNPPDPAVPEEPVLPAASTAKEELARLKSGDPFGLEPDFSQYLTTEQIDILESCLYTWLAEVNYAYQYAGSPGVKERIMKKAGIDPQGNFTSGTEQAITHINVVTKYGPKTIEVRMDLGKPDGRGNLYPAYGFMQYEILPKAGIPSDLPKTGQIGRSSYTDIGPFVESVKQASDDSLRDIYQWQSLLEELVAGILIDKTVTEIIGNKNGAFTDAMFTIYAKPLFTYSKKVTIACPVDVYVYDMDGKQAGSIINNKPESQDSNVEMHVEGDSKTVYLTGNDYYLNLRGTDTGTMKYEVEEIANEEVCRNVQFLELQLKKDMQYEGYVFRPLNIDRDLYALRTVGASSETIQPDLDSYEPQFKKVQGMSLSQQNTSIGTDRTVQLNASLFPLDASNPNLQWISDNPSVATVGSDGLVTAVGAGRATITVMTRDGSFLKQSCIIDVESKIVEPDDPANPDNPETPVQPDDPANPETPTQPDDPSKPETPAQPGTPSTQPGTPSTQPGTPSTQPGTPSTQPGTPSTGTEQPKEEPVVAKLYYIVQFSANGGTNLSRKTMTLLKDDTLGILPKVQRKAYVFSGWYTMQTGGTRVYGDKKLNEAATLYARWTKAAAPAKAKVNTLKSSKKGQVRVAFQKVSGAAGYQIQYSTSKAFTSVKTQTAGAATTLKTLTGLKAGKKYYVRMRAYRKDSMGNKIYGAYSAAKSVKVKT